MNDLLKPFENLEDPRTKKGNIKYPLKELLLLCLCGAMCGCKSWEEIQDWGESKLSWLKQFYAYENGICSEDTLMRVFSKLNFKTFAECFGLWIAGIIQPSEHIALDGKYMNGNSKIGMVHAVDTSDGTLLNIAGVEGKGKELEGIKELIPLIARKGALISIDALGCQVKVAELIMAHNSDYLLQLKANQKTLHEDVVYYCKTEEERITTEATGSELSQKVDAYHQTLEKDHGRIEERICRIYENVSWLNTRHCGWQIKTIVHIKRIRTEIKSKKLMEEDAYYISSKKADACYFMNATRNHWAIENKLHWVLDVNFGEDQQKIYIQNQAKNFAIIVRMAMHLVKQQAKKDKKAISRTLFRNNLSVARLDSIFLKI
jgi:predicted transposase YbfD/YdcC